MRRSVYFAFVSREFVPVERRIICNYEIGFEDGEPLRFTESLELPDLPLKDDLPPSLLNRLLDDLHLMLGISYYKSYCPPEIRLSRPLSKDQALFWETVYRKGLGEFAYRNDLDLRDRLRFPYEDIEVPESFSLNRSDRSLAGIGGGKDSAVALELLKEMKHLVTGFIVETSAAHEISEGVAQVAGVPVLKIRRLLDEKIRTHLPDSYNGHIPISAVFAFIGTLAAALYDYKYIVVGNEHSSNFGNIDYLGETINHQWSKSAEFEAMFQEYLQRYLTPSVTYFSLLRPFYEIRIAAMFAKYPQYFSHVTSCNRSFRSDVSARPATLWCGECAKCAFVFLILAPYIARETLVEMFGKDLLNDPRLKQLYGDILGYGEMKPFDCVGTFEEARAALWLIRDSCADAVIVQAFLPRIEHADELIKEVFSAKQALTVPSAFRFCGMKNALILGYGKEGEASERYLKERFPQLEIGIADESRSTEYLDEQDAYDISMKTPGIPKANMRGQYVTATNLFFSQVKNPIIGITGSKGKSTTASLIHHIFCEAGVPARLAGNIGLPMLELLIEGLDEKTLVILELSSYQLDDLEFSPHIALVTSLFPEHMNYHGSVEAYYRAKENIMRFQNERDIFVYNPAVPELRVWAEKARGSTLSFTDQLPFPESAIPLLGAHNIENVRAAVTVAQLFEISDEVISRAVANFKGLPHRLELVGEFKGIRFYDDAISTTPESTIAALNAIPNVGTLFLGGYDRGYDFSQLEAEVRSRSVANIVLFPESGKKMFADRAGLNILETSDMKEAIAFAYAHTKAGDACLLSCASPSYGLWKNFEEKGDQFKEAVTKLAA